MEEKDLQELNESFSSLETDVIDIRSDLKELESQVVDMNSCVDDIEDAIQSIPELFVNVKSCNDSIVGLKAFTKVSIENLNKVLEVLSENTNSNTGDVQNIQEQIDNCLNTFIGYNDELESVKTSFRDISAQVSGLDIDAKFSTTETKLVELIKQLEEKLRKTEVKYRNISASAGASRFNELLDVSISNPTNGQVPVYNSTTGKWENDDIATGGVQSVVAGTNVTVDDTDPANPIVSATGGLNGTLTATRIPYATGTNTLGDSEHHVWDNTTKTMGVQVDTPKATVHSSATIGQTIADISTASVSLVAETLPNTPTGIITQIAEPTAGSGGSASYVDGGSGSAITANGNSYEFRVYPCLLAVSTYYRSQYSETLSAGTDPNDSQMYNISLSWGTASITGETVEYFVEYDMNGSGSWSPIGIFSGSGVTLTSLSGGDMTTPFPTFYTNSVTAPTPFTGGSASGQDIGSGSFTEVPITVLMEVDSVKNIGGTDYVSGSPTTGSFDDTGMGTYNPEIAWTDNGNASNAVARVSQDNGSTWIYQFVGSTTSPYKFTSTSNDPVAEALWGQTYSGTGITFTFKPYGQGSAPSGVTLYSTVGTNYTTTISDTQNYILKHTFTGNALGKVLDNSSTYGQSYVSGAFYDVGYTTWASGTTVTPNSYGFTGTAQNRDYKLYGYSTGLAIYSQIPLTISTTASGGSKSVSGSFTLPSGVNQVRIIRQVNGGGYTHGKLIASGTTFTDDSTDTSWTTGAITPITPTSIMGVAGRFDKASTSVSMTPAMSVVHIGGGVGSPQLGFGVATDENSDVTTYVARLGANTSTGYMQAVTGRFDVGASFGGTPIAMIGITNVFNNQQSSSVHFNVKSLNDAGLQNSRADMDTMGFGQAIGTDQATTVQIHPARSSDAGLVMIGHASMSDSSTLMRFQTNAGSYTAEMTVGGWLRTSTGAVGNPSLSCRSDTNTGIYFPTADTLGLVTGGSERIRIDNGGNVGIGTTNITARLDINQVSLGQAVLRLRSEATNDDPSIFKYQNRVATTDATVTTLHSIATVSNNSYIVEAKVLARRTGGSAGTASDTAGYKIIAVFKNNAGTLTQVGTTTVEHTSEDQAGWNCTFDTSGTTIRVRVTGATNNNITWHLVDLEMSNLSS